MVVDAAMRLDRCPYCGAADGTKCAAAAGGLWIAQCRACGRVVQERRGEVKELFVERAQDSPLCIVTPDFSENECYRVPPLEDDPFENIGFITAFDTWSLESVPLFTATNTSFSGELAELERVLSESNDSQGGNGLSTSGLAEASGSFCDLLRAYFQIMEVSSLMGLERDSSDHAMQLFRDCASTTLVRNWNIEALATAALVQAVRDAQEPHTLQEISEGANIPQKDIGRYMKVLSDALKLNQPTSSNFVGAHMPRFCNLLQLSNSTQELATHIGEVVLNKCFCTRRNPVSISAAAIYLSCQLEDKKKTQSEICKATGLTEVTLRKVYKELLENLDQLLPSEYTPAVPPGKALPAAPWTAGGASVGGALLVADPPAGVAAASASCANTSATPGGEMGIGAGAMPTSAGHSTSLVLAEVGGGSLQGATPPAADHRSGIPFFQAPQPAPQH